MREIIKHVSGYNVTGMEFKSISEFITFLQTNENTGYGNDSHTSDSYFTGTASYEEALKLLVNGWTKEAKKLTQTLNADISIKEMQMQRKQVRSVAGGHALVAAYLNGAPNNMVMTKMEPKKQKVITVTKAIGYMAGVSKEEIRQESIKALKVVMKLEQQGYRVNLNVMSVAKSGSNAVACKIRIKNASEKLNISKVAFPLVHSSMLRRFVFNFREVYKNCKVPGYGGTASKYTYRELMEDHEYLIPNFINIDVDKTWCLEDLEHC